jgi:hypothetical protein
MMKTACYGRIGRNAAPDMSNDHAAPVGQPAAEGVERPGPSVLSEPCPTVLSMAKAARVLSALKRDGWTETKRSGSHRVLVKGDQQRIWA